ncbi:MAG TPA: primosomal protein DnaI [Atopostipes sp.]|nr:primosomal protein DnaI [Atopostipes sp.]
MDSIGDYLNKMTNSVEVRNQYQQIMSDVLKDEEVFAFITEHQDLLTTEAVERSAASLYEFVVEKEKARKGEGQLMPGYEPRLIVNNKRIEVSYEATPEHLAQRANDELKSRIRSVYMPRDIKNATFDGFEVTKPREEAFNRSLEFVEDYIQNPDRFHKGLYLYGAFGVGKTYLLGAIAHELSMYGYASTLVHFPTFATEMRSSVGNQTTGEKLKGYQTTPILMLDDIGAEYATDWLRDDILGVILQTRMQNELPTLFSSNLTMKEYEEHITFNNKGEANPLKAKRIMERIRFLSDEISVSGINRRNE